VTQQKHNRITNAGKQKPFFFLLAFTNCFRLPTVDCRLTTIAKPFFFLLNATTSVCKKAVHFKIIKNGGIHGTQIMQLKRKFLKTHYGYKRNDFRRQTALV
jgi:hypothetical protein